MGVVTEECLQKTLCSKVVRIKILLKVSVLN